MNQIQIPENYQSVLGVYDTQTAIEFIKGCFGEALSIGLGLKRVSAPLFLLSDSGLNDNLNGTERPVTFDIPATKSEGEVVHSLAKWKRYALGRYDFYPGNGLYTDMNAIRRDEELDNIHSVYVDQWDWERVITREQRTQEYFKETVCNIVNAICETASRLKTKYSQLSPVITNEVKFFTSQELENLYPNLTSKQREDTVTKEYGTVCVMQIGDLLASGEKHDGRAPDYDDWALNGDILCWNPVLNHALELSSMGIRVDAASLASQLEKADCVDRKTLPFHQMILNDELPLTIGGGIGQSRLCMLLLGKAHIGEVQASIWDKETIEQCNQAGIALL